MSNFFVRKECKLCSGVLDHVLSLGEQPLANALLDRDTDKSDKYPLTLVYCKKCELGQLKEEVHPQELFTDKYPFMAGESASWVRHCDEVSGMFHNIRNSAVVDIGANDGTLLTAFKNRGAIRVIGVEPANVDPESKIYHNIPLMWGQDAIDQILNISYQGVDIITATNVLAHTPDPVRFLYHVRSILKDNGVFYFEVPNFRNVIDNVDYDAVYHEHYSYFGLYAIKKMLMRSSFKIIDIVNWPTHGGSLGVFCMKSSTHVEYPYKYNLIVEQDLVNFRNRAIETNFRINRLVDDNVKVGNSVFAYGASAKATVRLNFGLASSAWSSHITAVFDSNPRKIGKYIPGTHIPIVSPAALKTQIDPDIILILSRNISSDLMTQARLNEYYGPFVII